MAFTLTCTIATVMYLRDRGSFFKFELLLPMAAGAIPLGVALLIMRVVQGRPRSADVAPEVSPPAQTNADMAAVGIIGVSLTGALFFGQAPIEASQQDYADRTIYEMSVRMAADGSISYQDAAITGSEFVPLCKRLVARHPKNRHRLSVHAGSAESRAFSGFVPLAQGCGLGISDISVYGD